MASNVLLLGVLYLQESSLISQHVHQQGQSSAKDVQLAGFLTFSTTTEAALQGAPEQPWAKSTATAKEAAPSTTSKRTPRQRFLILLRALGVSLPNLWNAPPGRVTEHMESAEILGEPKEVHADAVLRQRRRQAPTHPFATPRTRAREPT